MLTRTLVSLTLASAFLFVAGCATVPSEDSSGGAGAREDRSAEAAAAREPLTATELAVAERRAESAAKPEGSGGNAGEMAKLVDQLSEAARELATLRTTNAKLRAERSRPAPAPVAETPAPANPLDERLASSLKSFGQFRQEMANLLDEIERLKKANAELSADLKTTVEQERREKSALARIEEDLRLEKRRREEAESSAGQLRDQLRTIARAMADAGLSSEKLVKQAETASDRSRSTTSRYVAREGDTLRRIAERVYGDADKWRLIRDANRDRVGTDGAVNEGTVLQIPRN